MIGVKSEEGSRINRKENVEMEWEQKEHQEKGIFHWSRRSISTSEQ